MNLNEIINILFVLLIVSVSGYILVVLKEKLHLKSNIIIIDKKNVTQEQIDEADIKTFLIGKDLVNTGDEIKIYLRPEGKVEGVVIGARKKEDEVIVFTYQNELKKCKVRNIKRVKVVSKYGKFFKLF